MFPNLDAEMARRKITKSELAEKLHRTPTTVSLKLSGKAPITLSEAKEIRNAVDPTLGIDYLFSLDPEKESA